MRLLGLGRKLLISALSKRLAYRENITLSKNLGASSLTNKSKEFILASIVMEILTTLKC